MTADQPLRIGVYVCHCGSNIAGVVDVEQLAAFAEGLPGVALSAVLQGITVSPLPSSSPREFGGRT